MKPQVTIPVCDQCQSRLCSIFGLLSKSQLEDVALNKSGNFYQRGQTIFFQGTRPFGMYCISSGKVKVYKLDAAGREQIVRLARPGDILGYRSLISGEPYSAFAAPLEPAVVCFIPREIFFRLIQQNQQISIRLLQILSRDLKTAENRISDLSHKPVKERLAETLLLLREFYGLRKDDATLDVNLTREDLANIVGTATETVIRFLSEFKDLELIEIHGRRIKIRDLGELVRIANIVD